MAEERIITGVDASDLTDRERMILAAIVETHIDSREPVGSRTLAERLDLRVSPATIRNVMSALAERGLIQKPHPSAGRIPTAPGLRFYVDSLLRLEAPPEEARVEIDATLRNAGTLNAAMGEAGRVLSRLARHACVVRAPRAAAVRLKHIEFVSLRPETVLVVMVSEEGVVQNRLVNLSSTEQAALEAAGRPIPEVLASMSRKLSEDVEGKTLEDVRRGVQQAVEGATRELEDLARSLVAPALEASAAPGGLTLEGEHHLLDPGDVGSLARMRELYDIVEEKGSLLHLIDNAADAPGVRIFIGQESGYRSLADMSLVTATYGRGGEILGSLGVIGPMHMDYAKVVPLVQLTAQAISRLLGGIGPETRGA